MALDGAKQDRIALGDEMNQSQLADEKVKVRVRQIDRWKNTDLGTDAIDNHAMGTRFHLDIVTMLREGAE